MISFLHTVFKHADLTKTRTCLILCPVNVISNWAAEFSYWLSGLRPTIRVHQFSHYKTRSARLERLNKWQDKGGVMLMGYEIYRRMTNDKHYHRHVSNPGPDLVVCDEGHVLKNANAGISKALNQIRTKRRIILTGTPLQNNLKEYYFMVHFVKPHLRKSIRFLFLSIDPMTLFSSLFFSWNFSRIQKSIYRSDSSGTTQRFECLCSSIDETSSFCFARTSQTLYSSVKL